MSTERNIVSIWISKWGCAFDIEWDLMCVQIIPQGEFDRDSADNPLQSLDAGAAHAVVGVAQGAGGVGDAANGEIGGVGDADEVGF